MEGYDEKARLYRGVPEFPDEYDFIPEVHLLIDDRASGEDEETARKKIDEIKESRSDNQILFGNEGDDDK